MSDVPNWSESAETTAGSDAAQRRSRSRTVDVIGTIVGMVLIVLATPSIYVLSGYVLMGHPGCYTAGCGATLLISLRDFTFTAPIFVAGLTFGMAFVSLLANRRSWWIPPVGLGVVILIFTLVGLLLDVFVSNNY